MTEEISTQVSWDDQVQEQNKWQEHLQGLKGQVDDDSLRMALMWVAEPTQIGFGQGQIRPGELGWWDLFFELEMCGVSREARLLLCGLTEEQVAEAERRDWLEVNFEEVLKGMVQEAFAGQVEDDSRRSQERRARVAQETKDTSKCRRCQHPYGSHTSVCGAITRKGNACACPKLVR